MKFAFLFVILSKAALACMGPAEFYSVVKPYNLSQLEQNRPEFTAGDVLALNEYVTVVSGKENLVPLKKVGDTRYFVLKLANEKEDGSIVLRANLNPPAVDTDHTFKVIKPRVTRSYGCGDHRK